MLKSDKTYGSSVPSEKALAHSLEKPRDSPGDVGASADMDDKVSVGNARLKMYDREDSLVSAILGISSDERFESCCILAASSCRDEVE